MSSNVFGKYLARMFSGQRISQRQSGGYINATEMCKVQEGKKLNAWRRNQNTQAYLVSVSITTGVPIEGLVESKTGSQMAGGGTWIHPRVAVHLAFWVSPEFGNQVMSWASRFISGDLTLVADLVKQHEEANPDTSVLATVTTAGADVQREAHQQMHRVNVLEQENTKLKVRIVQVVDEAKNSLIEIKQSLVQSQARVEELTATGAVHKTTIVHMVAKGATYEATIVDMAAKGKVREAALLDMAGESILAKATIAGLTTKCVEIQQHLSESQRKLNVSLAETKLWHHMFQQCYQELRQTGDAESMPTRYLALHNMTTASCGTKDMLLRDLNHGTFRAIAINFARWQTIWQPTREHMLTVAGSILAVDFDTCTYRTSSTVCWFALFCGVFRTLHKLQHSTYATLDQMLQLTTRFNDCFKPPMFPLNFKLPQQQDLEKILDRTHCTLQPLHRTPMSELKMDDDPSPCRPRRKRRLLPMVDFGEVDLDSIYTFVQTATPEQMDANPSPCRPRRKKLKVKRRLLPMVEVDFEG